ncbi:hypothetical protein Tco_0972356 [Tanacetum coccineum]
MAYGANEARQAIVLKLQREIQAEETLADQLSCNLARYTEETHFGGPVPLGVSTLLGNMTLPFAIVTDDSPLFPRVASTCTRTDMVKHEVEIETLGECVDEIDKLAELIGKHEADQHW